VKITFEHRTSPERQQRETLLKEYELAQHEFYSIERTMWHSANIFILLSLGGVTFLATLAEHNLASLTLVMTVGLASIVILWVWYGALNRWAGIEQVMAHRMEEIEHELGMWKVRYISHLDGSRPPAAGRKPAVHHHGRLAELDARISRYPNVNIAQRIRLLFFMLVLGWVVIIVREIALVTRVLDMI
jgi:hypothetical protein